MIRWLEELPCSEGFLVELEEACPAEAAMIWAEAPLLGHGNAGLWQQEGENGPTALLLRNTAGAVTAAVLDTADEGELSQFLQVAGFGSLTLPAHWAEKLTLPDVLVQEYTVMEWQEEYSPLPEGFEAKTITAQMLLQNTLVAFGEAVGQEEQQEWLWAFGLRLRRQTALAMGLFQHSEMQAAAALSHIGRSAGVIGFVGTPPNKRGQGHGRRIAAVMADYAVRQAKKPLLCCLPQLEKMYRTAGFVPIGKQAVLKNR